MNPCLALSTLVFAITLDLGSGQVVENGCASLAEGNSSFNENITVDAMTWFQTPSVVIYSPACTGEEALGLESGLITNKQITASSFVDKNHSPANGRLNLVATGQKTGAWSAATKDQNQWLQVDFDRNVQIAKFASQGRQDRDEWVKEYKLYYSEDGGDAFKPYQENGADKVFTGNTDQNSVVTHKLLMPITARFVQIKPTAWNKHISMRVEFYGCALSDRYQVVGRVVHMDFVEEHLRTKRLVNFGDSQERSNNIELEVLADTIYIKGDIKMRGIKKLTLFSRKVTSMTGSRLELSAPTLPQTFLDLNNGADGDGGKHGVPGAIVEIFADFLNGDLNIVTNGGNGNKGQNGQDGRHGADRTGKRPDKAQWNCRNEAVYGLYGSISKCDDISGDTGHAGGNGRDGGHAGKAGSGGNAGHQTLYVREIKGKLELNTCRGSGAQAATNGKGGAGGQGGQGGWGIKCKVNQHCTPTGGCQNTCDADGKTTQAAQGATGTKGKDGQTPETPGSDGEVTGVYVQKLDLNNNAKKRYPLVLLQLMNRYAANLIWSNKIEEGGRVFRFIVDLTENRTDASDLRKVAQRRLGFLNKAGFDRFGRNKLFAPLSRWAVLKTDVEAIRDNAQIYENAYNDIKESIERQDDLKTVLRALPVAASVKVRAQKDRLVEARRIAMSEKELYVISIDQLEEQMKQFFEEVNAKLPEVYEKSQFNKGDLFALLQGFTGFIGGIAGKNPFAVIGATLSVVENFATKCNTGPLQELIDKVEKWLTFGKEYEALEDSSDLDFNKLDIGSVPEVMKANLEMKKEALATALVCLLDERSKPRNKAEFEQQIANFFILGATRIDLIAKILDLDNDIGGYNFDIANLERTANEIESLRNTPDAPIAADIQQTFLDDLLESYRQLETRFARKLYKLYRGFEFQSLWSLEARLAEYQQRASSAAEGTGSLQGVLELTKALQDINELESEARTCFTNFHHATDTHKWYFDSVKDGAFFDELHKGQTRFTIKIADNQGTSYNVRLLKMYIELYGDGDDAGDGDRNPTKVYLNLRHMAASYFRDESDTVKEYRQPLGSTRKFQFARPITNETRCAEERAKGNRDSLFCMAKDDSRFQPMCCHYLSDLPCDADLQLGAQECQSPFGTYEFSIPIDDTLACQNNSNVLTDQNCKDFDRTKFTKMNVWVSFLYWSGAYPTGPDDARCTQFQSQSVKSKVPWPKPHLLLKHKPKLKE